MVADKRRRTIRRHITANQGPKVVDWASPVAEEAFRYGPAPLCVSGGFGSGKTATLAIKALWMSAAFPKNRGVIARRVWEELRHTTMATFFQWCKPEAYRFGGKRSDTEKILQLNNGSEILWMHMDDPETENVVRGLEINWFLIDQAEEMNEQMFDLLMSRLGRWSAAEVPQALIDKERAEGREWAWKDPSGKPIVPTYAMLACNPDTELHWLYRRFHPESSEHQEIYKARGYKLLTMNSRDNKFLPKQNLTLLTQQDSSFVRRFVDGEWGIPEGQIHVVPKESYIPGTKQLVEHLQRTCTLHRSLDHGDASPTACLWWAVDRDGNLFCYREYYQPNKLISDHRRNIAALSEGERYQINVADPSIFSPSMQKHGRRWSVYDEYADVQNLPRHTAIFWTKGDNDELGTRNRISEYLRLTGLPGKDGKDVPRVHPITKELGFWPRIFFLTKTAEHPYGCENVVRELRSQRRERIGTDNGRPIFSDDRDESLPDHGYDALRYFVASRAPSAVFKPVTPYAGTWQEAYDRLKKFRKGGGWESMRKRLGRAS